MADAISSKSWLSRLTAGLQRSSSKLTEGITGVFTKRRLDDEVLQEFEEILIAADLGPTTAARLVGDFGKTRFGKEASDAEVKAALVEQIASILRPVAKPLDLDLTKKPFVILVVGVNGTGKTTTIGKFAQSYADHGLKVMLAAGDTFRAAAISQLQIWGDRAGVEVVAGEQGGDAAALAYQALEKARAATSDVLLIDTAGRLHNKNDLMQELAKIVRVIKKLDPSAPHATILTLDATTGQNAHAQVEAFREMTNVTGLVVTKLDGSAKGGVIVALADKFKLPIYAVGVGEQAEDLQPFVAEDFARALVGI
ncbi:MAG: signal recognition particle-docking protein FtsY [Alphaproteobacteria bacterium]|nr:signal recognition particle-docking protein FtsY [Alphaproteobacteria bacterium]